MDIKKITHIMYGPRFLKNYITFKDINVVQQSIVCPDTVFNCPFGIKKVIKYSKERQAIRILEKEYPNVCAQSSTSDIFLDQYWLHKNKIKTVFISPGMYADCDSVKLAVRRERKKFNAFDLLFVSSKIGLKVLEQAGISKEKIIIKPMPAFDLMSKYNMNRQKNQLLESINFLPKLIILFAGERCSKSEDINRILDNYDTILKLSEMAYRNRWLLIIKPKSNTMMAFLETIKRENKITDYYLSTFKTLISTPNVRILEEQDLFYPYFFADVIVDNGGSTVGVESCVARTPFVSVSERQSFGEMNVHQTLSSNCGLYVNNFDMLEEKIIEAHQNRLILLKNQEIFLDNIGFKKSKSYSDNILGDIIDRFKLSRFTCV